jgi:pyrimidine-specific ribonucleoside hydrolase
VRRRLLWGAAVVLAIVAAATAWFLFQRHQRLVAPRIGAPLEGRRVASPPAPAPDAPLRVWIDTDAGCGLGRHVDVDDCYALAMALAAPELDVRGIGTVFGNVPLAAADSVTRELVVRVHARDGDAPPIHRGAAQPGTGATAASEALAAELARGPLVVLAFGPATNVAAALAAHPERARNVRQVVFVGGKRAGQWMHPGYDHFITFSDFNVAKDPRAVEQVLGARVPVVLVPFEAALRTTLSPADVDAIARAGQVGAWLRARSGGWMAFWREQAGRDGFVPFDGAAVAYVLRPSLLECVEVRARLERSPPWFGIGRPTELIVRTGGTRGTPVAYCGRVGAGFDPFLMSRLTAAGR